MLYFAGIGSRQTPPDIQRLMAIIAEQLTGMGWILRSGGAQGADQAFESGARADRVQSFHALDAKTVAYRSVDWFHPYPRALRSYARQLMARNLYQITGIEVESFPINAREDLLQISIEQLSSMVICWTPDACSEGIKTTSKTGGTGQAIRIASYLKIPIYNLCNQSALPKLVSSFNLKI